MNTDSAKAYIEMLLDYQYDLLFLRNTWGVNHAEFIFLQTVRILKAHDEIKDWFMSKVESTLFSKAVLENDTKVRPCDFVPDDFIWFLAHYTRWPEFEALIQKIDGSEYDAWRSNPARTTSQALRDALSNNWEDKEFYQVFSVAEDWA